MTDKSEAVPTGNDFDARKNALADNLDAMVKAGVAEMTDAFYGFRLFLISDEFDQLELAARSDYVRVIECIATMISDYQEWEDSKGARGKKMDKAMIKKMETDLDMMFTGSPEMARAMKAVLEAV